LRRARAWSAFGLAVAATAAAAGLNLLIEPLTGARYPFLPFFAAVLVAALYGGLAGGMAAVVLSSLAVDFLWMVPFWRFTVSTVADQVSLAIFALIGTAIVILAARLRLAVEETSQTRHHLQTITDVMASGVARFGRDSRFLWASKRYLEFLGRSTDEVVGRTMPEVLGPESFEALHPYVTRVLAGEAVTFEQAVALPNREWGWILTAYTPQTDRNGEIDSWVAVITDITHRKLLEQMLRQADQRKDEFLATLAHELRNPLAPIRYCAHLLQRDLGASVLQRARETIERQVSHMARLLDDLLDVSRITRNAIELKLELIDLRPALEHAVEIARPAIDGAHHRLTISVPAEPLWVRADRTRITQILGNLLQNAAQYTEPGGHIDVHLEAEPDHAVVRVCDSGVGIPAEQREQIFELFSQIHPRGSGRYGGLGIGLAVVKRLVELHNGRIAVESAGLGKGSEFSVRLPRTIAPVSAERTANVTRLHGGTPRVLIVDDNADVVDSLAALLRRSGYLAHTATDGASALTLVETIRPDVIVLDLGMPQVNGYDVAHTVRRRPGGGDILLIAATGWGSKEDRLQTREAGFDAHLTKPLNPDELIRLIESRASRSGDQCDGQVDDEDHEMHGALELGRTAGRQAHRADDQRQHE
jgi:PAS domain S-box-containing protein